jgi:hypothetical protein
MTDNKTRPVDGDVDAFIRSVENTRRRRDAENLLPLFAQWTGLKPQLWGSGLAGKSGSAIIGFGRYAYTYASGRSGEFFMTGFSPRKANMAVYVLPGFNGFENELEALGPHRHSVSCLYLTNLEKNDLSALEKIVSTGFETMKGRYQWWPR